MNTFLKIWLAITGVSVAFLFLMCGGCLVILSNSSTSTPESRQAAIEEFRLESDIRHAVKQQLRSGVKFPDTLQEDGPTWRVDVSGDSATVAGRFTAENAYGQPVRHSFAAQCKLFRSYNSTRVVVESLDVD